MNITIVTGSMRHNSVSYRVALHLHHQLQHSCNVNIVDVRTLNLPHVQDVFSQPSQLPSEHRTWGSIIFNTDAFIMVTPEYNGSYTPAMKNVFDHFPKQSRKAFGIVTTSTGAMGGMRAAMQLQQLVPALFGILSPQMLIVPHVDKKFTVDGNLTDEGFAKSVNTFLSEFLWLAATLSGHHPSGI